MLGSRPLQELRSHEIDTLYSHLEGKLAPRTAHHVHMILGACLGTAHRKGLIAANPMVRVERVPSPSEADHGMTLDADQLRAVVDGFRSSTLFSVVAIAALAGLRRNEILGLQWSDLDVANKTLRIERAVEDTKGFGLRLKEPKSARHKRTIVIDDELIALLCTERDRHLRILAGVPDGMAVDLSLVKLPVGSLMFPKPPGRGRDFVPTALRRPRNVTKELARKAKVLGFSGL